MHRGTLKPGLLQKVTAPSLQGGHSFSIPQCLVPLTEVQPVTQHPALSTLPTQNTFAEQTREICLHTLSSSSTGTSWSRSSRTASTFPAPAAQCRAVRSVWKRRKERGEADVCTMHVYPPHALQTQICHPGSQNSPHHTGFSLAIALFLLSLLSGSDLC